MSNCRANSASVLSPLTAAKATFALKAGMWFRRSRLVMVSPVRHTSWPLSGRSSTYPAVQISRDSSVGIGQAAEQAPPVVNHTARHHTAPLQIVGGEATPTPLVLDLVEPIFGVRA